MEARMSATHGPLGGHYPHIAPRRPFRSVADDWRREAERQVWSEKFDYYHDDEDELSDDHD